jgi:hypothetical protein
MSDIVFDTEEKVKSAVGSFRSLLSQPGWVLFQGIVDANIEIVKQQLEEGIDGETKEDVNRLRDKLKIMREMRNTPTTMIAKLENKPVDVPSADPYQTSDELREERKNQTVDKVV